MRVLALSCSRYNRLFNDPMTRLPSESIHARRAAWMRILSLSAWEDIESAAQCIPDVQHDILRAPETGLVMLRGRMGATGAAFNFGEATVTRCAVRISGGIEGHAYVMGRNVTHARLAALCDALLQVPDQGTDLIEKLIAPLEAKLRAQQVAQSSKAAATRVDFFTMVRGDD